MAAANARSAWSADFRAASCDCAAVWDAMGVEIVPRARVFNTLKRIRQRLDMIVEQTRNEFPDIGDMQELGNAISEFALDLDMIGLQEIRDNLNQISVSIGVCGRARGLPM